MMRHLNADAAASIARPSTTIVVVATRVRIAPAIAITVNVSNLRHLSSAFGRLVHCSYHLGARRFHCLSNGVAVDCSCCSSDCGVDCHRQGGFACFTARYSSCSAPRLYGAWLSDCVVDYSTR